jgi:hypothetical protein
MDRQVIGDYLWAGEIFSVLQFLPILPPFGYQGLFS